MILFFYCNQEHFPEFQRPKQTPIGAKISFINKDDNQGLFKFINKVMSKVFELLFETLLPIILEELRNHLQLSSQRKLGYRFLFEEQTVIIVYVFKEEPYMFPTFLTPGVYALECIR